MARTGTPVKETRSCCQALLSGAAGLPASLGGSLPAELSRPDANKRPGVECPLRRRLTITPWCLGRPTMEGNTARGASSPANPALTMPEPLRQRGRCARCKAKAPRSLFHLQPRSRRRAVQVVLLSSTAQRARPPRAIRHSENASKSKRGCALVHHQRTDFSVLCSSSKPAGGRRAGRSAAGVLCPAPPRKQRLRCCATCVLKGLQRPGSDRRCPAPEAAPARRRRPAMMAAQPRGDRGCLASRVDLEGLLQPPQKLAAVPQRELQQQPAIKPPPSSYPRPAGAQCPAASSSTRPRLATGQQSRARLGLRSPPASKLQAWPRLISATAAPSCRPQADPGTRNSKPRAQGLPAYRPLCCERGLTAGGWSLSPTQTAPLHCQSGRGGGAAPNSGLEGPAHSKMMANPPRFPPVLTLGSLSKSG